MHKCHPTAGKWIAEDGRRVLGFSLRSAAMTVGMAPVTMLDAVKAGAVPAPVLRYGARAYYSQEQLATLNLALPRAERPCR
jgi:hypothetical protein